jgi:hypothetical protein
VTADHTDTARFGALAHTLWREQRLLDVLLYRMEVQQLVMAAGRTRWIERAAFDVEAALEELGEHELIRSMQVADVAPVVGLRADASLRDLIAASPEPWQDIFRDHQQAFLELVARVEETSQANRELVRRSMATMRELLSTDDGHVASADGYGRTGALAAKRRPVLLDREV